MPPVFKQLTSVIAWILFIVGCVGILISVPLPVLWNGDWRTMGVGVVSLFLAAVVIKIRHGLER